MAKLMCPYCESNNVQSLPMVYQSGVSTGKTTGSYNGGSFNVSDGSYSPNFGSISTSTISQTALSRQFSPPYTNNAV